MNRPNTATGGATSDEQQKAQNEEEKESDESSGGSGSDSDDSGTNRSASERDSESEASHSEFSSPIHSTQSSPRSSIGGFSPFTSSRSQPKRHHHKKHAVALLPEEFELVRSIKWLRAILKHKSYSVCLKELPCIGGESLARDELIQFAATVTEIDPIFSKILRDIAKSKDAAEIAM
eukprot:gene31656-39104_t